MKTYFYNLIVLTCLLSGLGADAWAARKKPIPIHYPRLEAVKDPNEDYVKELLELLFTHIPNKYSLQASVGRMQQARSIYEMNKENGSIDLLWSMATDERIDQLIAIPIPIDKGLLGWRIAMLKKKNQHLFSQVSQLEELKVFNAGQEYDWPDVVILKKNQLNVMLSSTYESLFYMLQAERFDYFPRSVIEIWNELKQHAKLDLVVDQHIALYYPTAEYFFVSKRHPEFAKDLEISFEKIIKNGQFEKLFQKHNQQAIQRSKLKERKIIYLNNPLLSTKHLPLQRSELWYRP
jgi:hypothetical protein